MSTIHQIVGGKGEKANTLVKYVFGCGGADYPSLGKTADGNRTASGGWWWWLGGGYLAQS